MTQQAEQPMEGTFSRQGEMDRVPIPDLETTRRQFIEWCAPLLTDEQLDETVVALEKFMADDGPAPKLHQALKDYDNQPGVNSWLDEFWRKRYLGRRDPIALNANFLFKLRDLEMTQTERAAALIMGSVYYKQLLDQEKIEVELQRGKPLCMLQLKALFSTTRIPGVPRDSLRMPYTDENPGPSTATHILVFHNGHAYKLEVCSAEGKPHTLSELEGALAAIIADSPERAEEGTSIGHLTTMPRAEWAGVRTELLAKGEANKTVLDTIETALFSIALEGFAPEDENHACAQLLHGDSANRFFDKTLTFIVFKDGAAGLNCEHAPIDGTAAAAMVAHLYERSAEEAESLAGASPGSEGAPAFARLECELDDDLKAKIKNAAEAFRQLSTSTSTDAFVFDKFGASKIKSLGSSPDAFLQIAYQMAHKRTKGFLGATYESVSTRSYDHGRTEAMRVVTRQIEEFVNAVDDETKTREEKIALYHAAAKKHVERAKAASAGSAPEQHLWWMQMIAEEKGAELGVTEPLDLFETPGWTIMRNDYLSTSATPAGNIRFSGFGATSPDCIGVPYILSADEFRSCLATGAKGVETMKVYRQNLVAALQDLAEILEPAPAAEQGGE